MAKRSKKQLEAWVYSEAKRVGLSQSEVPDVLFVTEPGYRADMYRDPEEEDRLVVAIPEEVSARSIKRDLRHEFAHAKLHSSLPERLAPKDTLVREVEATRLAEGRLTGLDLANILVRLREEEGLTKLETYRLVRTSAKELSLSGSLVTRAIRLTRQYYSRG